jgi:hypothetical protein
MHIEYNVKIHVMKYAVRMESGCNWRVLVVLVFNLQVLLPEI